MPGSFLREIASWGLCLVATPSHTGWWDGWSTLPIAPAYGSQPPTEGTVPTCKVSFGLVVVMVGGICWGKGGLMGCRYLMEDLSSSVPAYGILHIVNSFLPSGAYPLAVSWCYLGIFPRHSNVRQWWEDGFHTLVHSARCAWVPTATFHCGQCLKSTSPETQNGRCLSAAGSTRACRSPGPPPWSLGKADGWWNPVRLHLIVRWRSDDMLHYLN
jgi:hypothetical protein